MSNYIGIDLGTTFSAVAYIDETGRPSIIDNDRDFNLTPSCVADLNGQIVVGEVARKTWGNAPDLAAARFKRNMGTDAKYSIDGKDFTPTQLSAAVLKKIKDDVLQKVGDVEEAVITIPANFSNEAREATMQAGQAAGLKIQYIINEPTAAALYYAFQKGGDLNGNYVVFDLGGGTFDVSVVSISGNDVDVVASNGVQQLGGDDFDTALWKIVEDKYAKETGKKLDIEDFQINDAEEAKISLSKRKRVACPVEREIIDVSRVEFEEAISSFIAQIEMVCESTVLEAGLEMKDVSEVLLAGGSTRMPCITKCIQNVFAKEPISTVNVDEVVALGASLYAAAKSDKAALSDMQKKSVSRMKVSEVTNEFLGTIAANESEETGVQLRNTILIEKGEKLPCSFTKSFYTMFDGQDEINCTITETKNREEDPKFVKVIHEEDLKLPSGRSQGREVRITFSYDESQVIHATFLDVDSGREANIIISKTDGIMRDDDQLSQFLVD